MGGLEVVDRSLRVTSSVLNVAAIVVLEWNYDVRLWGGHRARLFWRLWPLLLGTRRSWLLSRCTLSSILLVPCRQYGAENRFLLRLWSILRNNKRAVGVCNLVHEWSRRARRLEVTPTISTLLKMAVVLIPTSDGYSSSKAYLLA